MPPPHELQPQQHPSREDRTFPDLPGQRGLATVAQLLEHGWTTSALREARKTRLQEPLPRVLAPHRGPIDGSTRLTAAALWAGPTAVLTGATALASLGVPAKGLHQATFVIPAHGRARAHRSVQAVRSSRELTVARRVGVRAVAEGARAIADAAVYEQHSADDLEHWTISVLQRGLASPEGLERELYLRPRAKVAAVWRGLAGFVDGAWSRPEVVLREVIEADGGFPALVTNCGLWTSDGEFIGTPDGYLEEAGTAIQVHSRQFHQGVDDAGGERWGRTVEKDSDYVAAGVRVVGVTPWTLYGKPQRFLNRLRKVVQLGLAAPRPCVRVVPRDG
ncbi:hypothetical protein [Ornithinimicrobium tianjinense]|uniref:Transcriptional regulator, AbiEi antitoxin, Type IV TA system n=1 Tax=Ornithinimicrobium tianjinense TaxID=1195761 RepID=A0A917F5A0_9MICO|nr:hypothetical protein [Ornithinimicrobium tianjinense]GGF44844.1 hypothetical protein GCM10011366_10720 [Ornithinimicrobium tianjinense]